MENYKKPSTSKLAKRFDNELKSILMEDVKAYRNRTAFSSSNNQSAVPSTLSAA
jgi:hypothetical protein